MLIVFYLMLFHSQFSISLLKPIVICLFVLKKVLFNHTTIVILLWWKVTLKIPNTQQHSCTSPCNENSHSKASIQNKRLCIYVIITFHISLKIPFPSAVILLHRSNGCILQLWQGQPPPLSPPHRTGPYLLALRLLKNQSRESKYAKWVFFFLLWVWNDWNRDVTGGRLGERSTYLTHKDQKNTVQASFFFSSKTNPQYSMLPLLTTDTVWCNHSILGQTHVPYHMCGSCQQYVSIFVRNWVLILHWHARCRSCNRGLVLKAW